MQLLDNPQGGYRFLTGIAPFSSGVIAMPGYEIVHVVVRRLLPYRQGFDLIARHLEAEGRPRQALGAIELRSPHPLSFEGFADFNRGYIELLDTWDLLVDGHNPMARTNVATVHPIHDLLPEVLLPSLQQAAGRGLHWYYSRPPIIGLEFEMDMRGVDHERRLE